MVLQLHVEGAYVLFGRFFNTFSSEDSPIFLPRFGSVFSRTTSFVLKMIFFSYAEGVRESVRTRDMGWSFRHSSRITNFLECVFTLDHCICT